jgi:Uma2 family endonuclease
MAIRQPQTRLITLEEFKALPEGPPYFEFEEGELIPVVSPGIDHQDVVDELLTSAKNFVRDASLGRVFREVDVYLPDGRVFIPDFGFLTNDQLHFIQQDRKVHGVPTLVVEVTSTNVARDRSHKFQVYQANGVPWYWLVESKFLLIEEYKLTPDGYLRVSTTESGQEFTPKLFPGLSINLAMLLGVAEDEAPA